MAGALHLISGGARGSGLTRKNPYESLHSGHLIRQPKQHREPSPSIFAPPRGDSSDEDLDGQEAPDDGASDDSEFGRSEERGKSGGRRALRSSMVSMSALGEEGKKRDLSVEPSNIRASTFTSSGKGPGSRNGSQTSLKRNSFDFNDDPPFASQNKKPRHSYGRGSMSKYQSTGSPVTKPGNPSKLPTKGSEKAGRSIKIPDNAALLAQGRITLCIAVSQYVRLTSIS